MKPDPRKIQTLMKAASRSPFFKRKWGRFKAGDINLKTFREKVPAMRLEELLAERIKSGDPFASRWLGNRGPLVVFQLDYDTEPALYLPLDEHALRDYAEALRRCWSLLGLKKGAVVAIFDYGTSPLSYLASSAYTPYLRRGAAEALGCLAICNDGIASMSQRAVEILKFVRPRVLFVRGECLQPLALEIEGRLPQLSDFTHALVVSENESLLTKADQEGFERRLGVPVYRLLRADIAMFLAMECPECRLLHCWQDLYSVDTGNQAFEGSTSNSGDETLVVTNWFARSCPTVRYVSQVRGAVVAGGCSRSRRDIRIVV